ncbi:hypothetical protein [Novosphingobium sp.]|uniref:hypothetical protein n=1 Tax=Novosphingobium sp. TaxID=1874826 RepID=UPI00260B5993|nr:hypothetical protein [Novosphingobium sp.]
MGSHARETAARELSALPPSKGKVIDLPAMRMLSILIILSILPALPTLKVINMLKVLNISKVISMITFNPHQG